MVFLIYPWKIHLSLGQKSCNLTTRLLETLQSCPRLFAATTDSIEAFFARTYMKKRSPCLLLPLCRASKQAKYLMECRTSAAQRRIPTFIKWHPETMKSSYICLIQSCLASYSGKGHHCFSKESPWWLLREQFRLLLGCQMASNLAI